MMNKITEKMDPSDSSDPLSNKLIGFEAYTMSRVVKVFDINLNIVGSGYLIDQRVLVTAASLFVDNTGGLRIKSQIGDSDKIRNIYTIHILTQMDRLVYANVSRKSHKHQIIKNQLKR